MRRALDTARAKLDALSDRSAILECFFEHACTLFQVAVVLVVKGDSAHGRYAVGLEVPEALVARLVVPLDSPGVVARARDLRRPFVGIANMTDADATMFGTLGRAMPQALVCPLVVRDRVVAVFVGDTPAEKLHRAAIEAGRTPMDLAKEEMLLWAESVGEALERSIRRRKGGAAAAATGSVPPPRFSSAPPPADLSALPAVPKISLAPPRLPIDFFAPSEAPPPMPPKKPRGAWIFLAVAGFGVAVAGTIYWRSRRADADWENADRVVAAGSTIPGWPNALDAVAGTEPARRVAALGDKAQLGSIDAEVVGGKVDATKPSRGTNARALTYVFVTDENESEVGIDGAGVHAPRLQPRARCGEVPCRLAVPDPTCAFARILDTARASGLRDEDRAHVTYADGAKRGPTAVPEWIVAVEGRGRMRIDPGTCQPLPRERLRPVPLPLASVPGAPKRLDATGLIDLARKQSGLDEDATLVEIDARGVNKDGLVDLDVPDSSIAYTFSDPPSIPPSERRWRRVEITAKDGVVVTDDEVERGPLPTRLDPGLASPRCSLAAAYRYLSLTGAPQGAVRVTYDADASHHGRWTIELAAGGTRHSDSDLECEAWVTLTKK